MKYCIYICTLLFNIEPNMGHIWFQITVKWLSWTTFAYVYSHYLFRPDGEKKAYVRLAPDYDALDVANKVSFIPADRCCNVLFYRSLYFVTLRMWCKHYFDLNVCDAFKGTTDARCCSIRLTTFNELYVIHAFFFFFCRLASSKLAQYKWKNKYL